MKKVLLFTLVVLLCLSFTACGSKTLTLESLSSFYVDGADDVRADFELADGIITVKIIHYVESSISPTGKVAGKTDSFTKEYTLEGENYIIVEGKKYYYEINEEKKQVEFSVKFMDLSKTFYYGYIKD